ncbi:FeoB-associated Cys-rich membrane protein [Candidatus Soleaferrea massiliensis]|uniref:FeoB-associated Cys-rich membrane protein n=1 Tax=Candidatus Soleaferrea massiliensis TaxID=1470354 RepID=UPI0009E65B86|nr:FeoB-associated Cys-rich membrane protein [Candidatus Soleaferrea massiliensis]
MLSFFASYGGTIIIGVVLAAIVALIVAKLIRDRRKGKSSCGCGCENCPSSGMCHKK